MRAAPAQTWQATLTSTAASAWAGTQTAATAPAASARAGAQTAATARAGTQQPLREIMASEDSDEEWEGVHEVFAANNSDT